MRALHCWDQDVDRPDPQYHHGRTPGSGCTGTTASQWIGLKVVAVEGVHQVMVASYCLPACETGWCPSHCATSWTHHLGCLKKTGNDGMISSGVSSGSAPQERRPSRM